MPRKVCNKRGYLNHDDWNEFDLLTDIFPYGLLQKTFLGRIVLVVFARFQASESNVVFGSRSQARTSSTLT